MNKSPTGLIQRDGTLPRSQYVSISQLHFSLVLIVHKMASFGVMSREERRLMAASKGFYKARQHLLRGDKEAAKQEMDDLLMHCMFVQWAEIGPHPKQLAVDERWTDLTHFISRSCCNIIDLLADPAQYTNIDKALLRAQENMTRALGFSEGTFF